MYLHWSKEENYETGEELWMSEEALQKFAYALYEVEFEVEIDIETWEYEIISTNE